MGIGTQGAVDDTFGITTVLGAVGIIDLSGDVGVGSHFHEGDVFVNATSLDVTLVVILRATKPRRGASINRANVQVVTNTDDPNCS